MRSSKIVRKSYGRGAIRTTEPPAPATRTALFRMHYWSCHQRVWALDWGFLLLLCANTNDMNFNKMTVQFTKCLLKYIKGHLKGNVLHYDVLRCVGPFRFPLISIIIAKVHSFGQRGQAPRLYVCLCVCLYFLCYFWPVLCSYGFLYTMCQQRQNTHTHTRLHLQLANHSNCTHVVYAASSGQTARTGTPEEEYTSAHSWYVVIISYALSISVYTECDAHTNTAWRCLA